MSLIAVTLLMVGSQLSADNVHSSCGWLGRLFQWLLSVKLSADNVNSSCGWLGRLSQWLLSVKFKFLYLFLFNH